ncbi:hypothetical protein ACLMJK_000279 [Lecanora helva]
MAVWTPPSDAKSSRLLFIYCVISTIFCLRFINIAKHNSDVCDQSYVPLAYNASFTPSQFPKKIWQTSKTSPAGLEELDRKAILTWVKINQKHRYEIITQHTAESYVREKFAHRQDIVEVFMDLQDPILRADLIRYLVLLGDGGVYSDIDTRSLKPIEDWVPSAYRKDANLVIGVEYDTLGGGRWVDWTLDLQFATWAILAKPGHLFLEITVERVIERLRRLAFKQERAISQVRASYHEVLETTGPSLFTMAVFEGLSYVTGTNFTHLNISGLAEPRLVGDVLILPINAFGSGQAHSNSGSPESDTALVHHLFKGSWKGDHKIEQQKPEIKKPEEKKPEEKKPEEKKQEEKKQEKEEKKQEEKKSEEKKPEEKKSEEKKSEGS